ncbi:prepilin-type N-terminal cleavage/methylation domain-containing protein [Paenibacillus catalpae]|uniref:Prepilin-type N-terminal cleavage/methylation domain-containing protein n=1 Tax=Paenibacillus catalpae TaxID=1045775 RepID=A0A1I2EW80_9BACL|nr:prepilin-type N-terminal cleavage/methylation domain-containing protein [Paenibacillus catalpae]SFE97352.1 prepilin-type N-terminal cleavage/methylation domain-containing protein [Paenibacillus catalpae]
MREFVKRWRKEEKGLTLVELIATMTLLSIAAGVIFSVITYGMNTYNRIETENALRDDADLLMSSIITELYSYGPDIIAVDTNGIRLVRDNGTREELRIFFENNQLRIGDRTMDTRSDVEVLDQAVPEPAASSIDLKCTTSATECSSGLIEIRLVLEQNHNGRDQQLTLESKFGF